jgi:hypothetical protein
MGRDGGIRRIVVESFSIMDMTRAAALSVTFRASTLQAWQNLRLTISLSSILFIFPLLDDLS